jgi:hypothetical protein
MAGSRASPLLQGEIPISDFLLTGVFTILRVFAVKMVFMDER